ncbi:MAG: hypothetical protein DWQ36_22120 [Acidobacteria bacterium]|nr:MAG: hypothetical protein DWQ30_00420 [Acidobacteriota bacterium]REK00884.1 MAG: hypothetical protein DWQ36_22120 [Acidobacteriota bacterium]
MRSPVVAVAVVASAVAGLLAPFTIRPARAHSAWPDLHSTRTEVGCREASGPAVGEHCRLRVLVTLEVPAAVAVVLFQEHWREVDLAAEIRAGRIEELEDGFRARQFERLAGGIALRIGGEEPPGLEWKPSDRFGNGYGLDGFFVYEFEAVTTLPIVVEERTAVVVRHGNFAGDEVMFSHLVDPSAPLRVVAASVAMPPEGADLTPGSADETALWSSDESRRVFELVVEPEAHGEGNRPP